MDLVYLDRVGMNNMVCMHQAHVNEGIIFIKLNPAPLFFSLSD